MFTVLQPAACVALLRMPHRFVLHAQAWHTSKLALISCILWVPTAIVMLAVAYSSKQWRERNLHLGIPIITSGIAFT